MHRDYLSFSNLSFIEKQYQSYCSDPESVEESWRYFFEGMKFGETHFPQVPTSSKNVSYLIDAYRRYGHLKAKISPVLQKETHTPFLDLQYIGFSEADLDQSFPTEGLLSQEQAPLREIIDRLQQIYTQSVGIQISHIEEDEKRKWLINHIESFQKSSFSHEEKMEILRALNCSEGMEAFIHMRYPGQKRFSLEGGETLIPMLLALYQKAGELGVDASVIGMAHRGRLNVLANLMQKPYSMIFQEFEKGYIPPEEEGSGDVKYHLGYMSKYQSKKGKEIDLILKANPSHLELVNPVVLGTARAYQKEGQREQILPLLIHGDASFAGQGSVYEMLLLAHLEGYEVGGSLHLVLNNQIGFTAAPHELQSTLYCTDIAKMLDAPIFHLNAEDPEMCVHYALLALEYRQTFGSDVFLDLVCYRKYGHNEGDEPTFTNPILYQEIKQKENIRNLYRDHLIKQGEITEEEAKNLEEEFKAYLQKAFDETKENISTPQVPKEKEEKPPKEEVKTTLSKEEIQTITEAITTLPKDFAIHRKLGRILEERKKMAAGENLVDWGMAEHLAYGSLLLQGKSIRISGEDSVRGTFSHRHAGLTHQETNERIYPLQNLCQEKNTFEVYNSPLSELGVLGFEYGYSVIKSKDLTIWEAQYGDFANGAQLIIDQFIMVSEQKWGERSPLVLFLPHGYEGGGPEHSSARIERFLQMCGDQNAHVVIPSQAKQLFHVLQKHILEEELKPLIVFTPKALLRYAPSLSPIEEFQKGSFEPVLDDPNAPSKPKRLILCAGKIYHEMMEAKRDTSNIAFLRIEQLYPFPEKELQHLLKKYHGFSECFYVQEEHENMGAWNFLKEDLQRLLPDSVSLRYVGRKRSSSQSAGSSALHKQQLKELLDEAFGE